MEENEDRSTDLTWRIMRMATDNSLSPFIETFHLAFCSGAKALLLLSQAHFFATHRHGHIYQNNEKSSVLVFKKNHIKTRMEETVDLFIEACVKEINS